MNITNETEWLSEDVVAILPTPIKERVTDLHISTLREPGTNLSDMSYFCWSLNNGQMQIRLPSRKRLEDSYPPLERLVHNEWLPMKRDVCFKLVTTLKDATLTRQYVSYRYTPRHSQPQTIPETFTQTLRMPSKHKTAAQRIPTVDEVLVDLSQARNRLTNATNYRTTEMARLVAEHQEADEKDRRRIAILEKRLEKAQRHAAKSTNGV